MSFIDKTKQAFSVYAQRRVLILLLLGFSSGLPLMLVFSTLSFWLREAGIDRAAIGYFSWIALTYAFKWLWSPLIDRLHLPFLSKHMGQRRSWMFLAQASLFFAVLGMAMSDPSQDLTRLALCALAVAFASASQDIVIDAFRIDSAPPEMQAALAAAYQMGYRVAMISATAGALTIAAWASPLDGSYSLIGWQTAYYAMAGLTLVGLITTLFAKEPQIDRSANDAEEMALTAKLQQKYPYRLARLGAWSYHAAILPFVDFFQRYGKQALLILALIACYRISDIVMGVMANVFYVDMGFSKEEIAFLSKVYGLVMTLIGAGIGGVLVSRFGVLKILFLGALMVASTNLLFALQAFVGYNIHLLTVVIAIDNLSAGIATAAFIAYLSSLTSSGYTATQYALLSSIMLLFPKFIAGFSGEYIDAYGYVNFFISCSLIGFPVLILIALVAKYVPLTASKQTADDQPNTML